MGTTHNVGRVFWRAFAASAIGLLLTVWSEQHEVIVFVVGVLPLIGYHIYLHRLLREQVVPQVTIDTIYYFGFLITILMLSLTVLKVALKGLETPGGTVPLKHFAVMFGLGLVATGYALFARIQLMTQTERIEEEDIGDKVDRYAQEAQKALDVMMRSAADFEAFAETVRGSAQQVITTAREDSLQAIKKSAEGVVAQFESTTAQIQEASRNLAGAVGQTAIHDDMTELKNRLRAVNGSITAVGNQLSRLGESVGQAQQSASDLSSAFATAKIELDSLSNSMKKIVEFGTPLADLRLSVANLGTQLRALQTESAAAKQQLTSWAGELAGTLDSVKQAAESERSAVQAHLDMLPQLRRDLAQLASSQAQYRQFSQDALRSTTQAASEAEQRMRTLAQAIEVLCQDLDALQEEVRDLRSELSRFVETSREHDAATQQVVEPNGALTVHPPRA